MSHDQREADLSTRELHTTEEVQTRVYQLAGEIIDHYKAIGVDDPVFVSLMKGAVPFTVDLMRAIHGLRDERDHGNFDPKVEYIGVSSYGDDTRPSEILVWADLREDIVEGKHVLIIDDLTDSGNTVAFTKEYVRERGALSPIEVCVLIEKVDSLGRAVGEVATFNGLEASLDDWVNGMGMDGGGSDAPRWKRHIDAVKRPD